MVRGLRLASVLLVAHLAVIWGLKVQEFDDSVFMERDPHFRVPDDFVPLSMIELEEHEDTPTPPFSVCKFLLESSAERIEKGSSWPDAAQHIATVRESLPEHVRTACDAFIKRHRDDIISMLELEGIQDEIDAVADEVEQEQNQNQQQEQTSTAAAQPGSQDQDAFKKFWEEKGQFCGACLTMTKKIQKWLSLNCTQTVIADRVLRMCDTMTGPLKDQCEASHTWISSYVLKHLFQKLPLPNHCAYIGLCEKTMVIRALANPVVMSDRQGAFIQDIEGVDPNLFQEGDTVLQRPHDTPTTDPEVTFNLDNGGVSYRDVDKSTGDDLPKLYIDGSRDDVSLLETSNNIFDVSNPDDPHVHLHAQEPDKVNIPVMHHDLKENSGMNVNKQSFGFGGNHLPIETKYLKGCAACQFTVGSLFEFMSSPRTIRAILPVIKDSCKNCNSPSEVAKCQEFVETQGVAFYQDVVRQGLPSKWCPRLELCEIQYFYPSPFVLSDNYKRVENSIKEVGGF
jgi:hypothetical protein